MVSFEMLRGKRGTPIISVVQYIYGSEMTRLYFLGGNYDMFLLILAFIGNMLECIALLNGYVVSL